MKNYLGDLPEEIKKLVRLAKDVAEESNVPVYLVGGFVRDLLLGVKNLDLDIVVEGDGISFAEQLAKRLDAKFIRHRRFGTATVTVNHHAKIDIASARQEVYPVPAALPVVTRSDLRSDLRRRDFTINAMAISVMSEKFGQLIDFFNGKDDLEHRRIRILHPLSFIDDPTRMLRAIRFEQRYNFTIEPGTLACFREALRQKMLQKVQPQRVRDELILLFQERNPALQLRRMQGLVGCAFISPRLTVSRETYRLFRSVSVQLKWFREHQGHRRRLDAWLIYFMGLVEQLRTTEIKSMCEKFMFRKGEEKRILSYKKIKRNFILTLRKNDSKPARIYSLLEPLSYEEIILLKAKYRNQNIQRHIIDFLKMYNGIRIHVSGHDLRGLGIAPGPQYQKIFGRVLEAKLNGRVKTKDDELNLIRGLMQRR